MASTSQEQMRSANIELPRLGSTSWRAVDGESDKFQGCHSARKNKTVTAGNKTQIELEYNSFIKS